MNRYARDEEPYHLTLYASYAYLALLTVRHSVRYLDCRPRLGRTLHRTPQQRSTCPEPIEQYGSLWKMGNDVRFPVGLHEDR